MDVGGDSRDRVIQGTAKEVYHYSAVSGKDSTIPLGGLRVLPPRSQLVVTEDPNPGRAGFFRGFGEGA